MPNIIHFDDYNLLDRYIKGDKQAGNEIFSSIYPAVEKYVFKNTNQYAYIKEEDKLDIIAESMSRVVSDCCLYNGSVPFKNFVIGYCRKVILEQKRKLAKSQKIVNIEDEIVTNIEDLTIIGTNPLHIIIKQEENETLQNAIELLSEDHRQVLTLRLFNKVPVKQIALLTGETESAIDSRYRRALIALKNNFEKIYF